VAGLGGALLSLLRLFGRAVARGWGRLGRKTRLRAKIIIGAAVLTSPVWLVNILVSALGHSVVFPLSPFFLHEKVSALGSYALHQPRCLIFGHADSDALVKSAESRHHLPRGLLAAIIHVESRGYPHRISSAGAMGPGQLMPGTARQLGVGDPFDSAGNIDGAARLMAGHLGRFHNVRLAVAAYNAGPGAVRGRVPENGQTPTYVARVMQKYAELRPRTPRPIPAPPPRRAAGERVRPLATAEPPEPPAPRAPRPPAPARPRKR
jgi:hypothetical protein